jgi:hypothetical protein
MAFDWGAAKPVIIESEAVPKNCLLMISPPKHFSVPADMPLEDQLFEFLMACKPSVITNIGGIDGI